LPRNIIIHKNYALANLGSKFLVYPLNTSFIRNLDPALIDKWVRAGWSIDKTVLLELDHKTIPAFRCPEDPASNLFSGVIYAWNERMYFKFVAFTKWYFEGIDEINLKVDCWHEQRHVMSAEESIFEEKRPPTEDDVVEEEIKHVYETLGEAGIKARSDHVLASIENNRDADAILGHVVVLWLREFFEERTANYRSYSTPIPQSAHTAKMKEMNRRMTNQIAEFYHNVLGIDPARVFGHSLGR
jgi:hypothetical protein